MIASILFLFPSLARAQESSQLRLKSKDVYQLETLEVTSEDEDPAQSFVGKPFDQELDDKELQKNQVQNVGELVDQIPGAENLGGPRKEAQGISIRGFQSRQVLLLLDGTRSNFSMTHNSVTPIRTHLLKKVDVLKGGASSRFGNGALGGLVSFSTIDAHDLVDQQNASSAGSLRGQYSDASAAYQSSLTAAQLVGDKRQLGIVADVTSTTSKDIRLSDDKALAYSGYEDQSIWAKTNWVGKSGHRAWFSAEQNTKESVVPLNPTLETSAVGDLGDQEEKYRSFKMQYKRKSGSRIRPEVLLYRNETELSRTHLDDEHRDNRQIWTHGLSLHTNMDVARQSASHSWGWSLQPGIELVRDDNNGDMDGQPLPSYPDGRAEHAGAYLLSDLTYKELSWLHTGIRYDEVRLRTSDPTLSNRINKAWSPEAEVGYQLTEDLSVAVAYEEGYNAPKIQDIFVDGLHFQVPGFGDNFFQPNVNLQPEDSQTVELRTRYEYGNEDLGGEFSWSEYESTIDNYIDQYVDLFSGSTQFINRPQVKLQGRELGWKQSIHRIQLGLTYSRVRSLKSQNGQPLSNSPADQIRMIYGYEHNKWFVGMENIIYRAQDRIDKTVLGAQEATPSSNVQNGLLGYKIQQRSYLGAARLKVNNIFDKEYQKHGTFLKEPGRDVRLELVLNL